MKKCHLLFPTFVLVALCLTGCASSTKNLGDGSGDPSEQVVTKHLGPNDIKAIAQKIADTIAQNMPSQASGVVRVRDFENRTGDTTFLMHELVYRVVTDLIQKGKLQAVSTDEAATEAFILKQKMKRQSGVILEDYTLSGRVTLDEQTDGNKRQYTYYFIFTLNDTNSGKVIIPPATTTWIKVTERPWGGL